MLIYKPYSVLLALCLMLSIRAGSAQAQTPFWYRFGGPDASAGLNAVADSTGDRVFVFGGHGIRGRSNDVWSRSNAPGSPWVRIEPAGTPPALRDGACMVFDEPRQRLIVFGGVGATRYSDLWALSLSGVPTWSLLAPSSAGPSPRSDASMILDPVRDRVIVFGGDASPRVNDTWAYSLSGATGWSQLTPTGTLPSARSGHVAVYDRVNDRMVVATGLGTTGSAAPDVRTLALAANTWSLLVNASLPAFGSAIYDPVRQSLIHFGGRLSGSNGSNDVTEITLGGSATVTNLFGSGTVPTKRYQHAAVLDARRHQMVILHGTDSGFYDVDVQTLSLTAPLAWKDALAEYPGGGEHDGVLDPARHCVWSPLGADLWKLDLTVTPPVWTVVPTSGPSPTNSGMLAFDGAHDRLLKLQGKALYELNLTGPPIWSPYIPAAAGPPFTAATAYLDAPRDRLLLFTTGSGVVNSNNQFVVGVYAVALGGAPAWTLLSPAGTAPLDPSNLGGERSLACDAARDRIYFMAQSGPFAFDMSAGDVWTPLVTSGANLDFNLATAVDPVQRQLLRLGDNASMATYASPLGDTLAYHVLTVSGDTQVGARLHPNLLFDSARDCLVVSSGGGPAGWIGCAVLDFTAVAGVSPEPKTATALAFRRIAPDPAAGEQRFSVRLPAGQGARLRIHAIDGALVHEQAIEATSSGEYTLSWDGRGADGRPVPPGVYFARLTSARARASARFVRLR